MGKLLKSTEGVVFSGAYSAVRRPQTNVRFEGINTRRASCAMPGLTSASALRFRNAAIILAKLELF